MTKKSDAPAIRFKGFSDAWEQRKLGDIASDMVAGGDIDKGLILAEGQYPVIANALTGDGIVGYYDKEYRVNAPAVTVTGRGDVGHAKARLVNFTPVVRLLSVKSEHDVFFLENAINTLKIVIESTGVPQLTVPQLAKYEVAFPRQLDEEEHIGAFFKQLDHLITLHQRKCVFLFGFFQAFISMIFTASTFSWEQRKLSEIADKVTEKNAGLQYVETFTNSAEFGIISQRDFFDHDIAKLGSLDGYYIVKNEDFVYNPRISTSAPVGPINRNKLGRTGVMSPLYTVFRPHDVDTTYLEHFFKCAYWHSFMNFNGDSGARSDRFSIKDDVFFQMPIPLPYIDEQRKIGELLTRLDHLITLHQRECISFTARAGRRILTANKKRNTSSWEQRKLGELVDRVVRKNTNNESTLPLTISAQYGLVDQITYFNNRVASRDVSNYYLVLNGEFAYNKSTSDGYPFGAVKRLDLYEKGVLSTLYIVFAPKKEQQIYSDYLTVFFDTDRWHKGVAERAAEGARNHGLLNISAEDFFDIDLSVPKDIVEQKQIGAFIRQLDNLITLHQRKPFLMKWRTSDANRNKTNRLVL